MGFEFDWQLEEEIEPAPTNNRSPGPRRMWLLVLLVAVVIGGSGGYIWFNGREQLDDELLQRTAQVEAILTEMTAAFNLGDLDPFFTLAAQDEVWQAQQLHPANIEFWQSNPKVTTIERNGLEVWANVEWITAAGETRQRVMFFEERGDEVRFRDLSRRFWGNPRRVNTRWGVIRYYNIDEPWIDQLDDVINDSLSDHCQTIECGDVTILLTDSWQDTASVDTLRLPSPRVWGLSNAGKPTADYWAFVAEQTAVLVGETTIRFGVPRNELGRYELLTAAYMEENPHRAIELVPFDLLPEEATEMLQQVDGAMMAPNLSLIVNGEIRDLTDFVTSDAQFDEHDFYEQIWAAGWWNDRMWIMPHTADLPLIYYDNNAYATSVIARPSVEWTWDDLLTHAELLTENSGFDWGIVGYNYDVLYSYAYNQSNACEEEVAILCNPVLQQGDIDATLEYYRQLAPYMPSLEGLTEFEKLVLFQNQVSVATSETPIWVDSPAEYEQHFISRAARVVPFPGSDQFGGVTPLHISGAVISIHSDQPRAVWEWLSYLSYQYPNRVARQVPARPSVARSTFYWQSLPKALQLTMLEAFPNSRPVLLEEQVWFTDEQLAAALDEAE